MSAPMDVLFEQRILKCGGFYAGLLDGKWGPKSDAAEAAFDIEYRRIRDLLGEADARSEGNIRTLIPGAQVLARKVLNTGKGRAGFRVGILSGSRTYAEQDRLYNQRPQVTKAPGGHSNHNFAIAWDIGIFVNGEYYDGSDKSAARAAMEEKAYTDFAAQVKALLNTATKKVVDWGGDWDGFKDNPHYEVHTGMTITEKRLAFEAGTLRIPV